MEIRSIEADDMIMGVDPNSWDMNVKQETESQCCDGLINKVVFQGRESYCCRN